VSPNKPQHILLPVRSSTIVASFAIALLLAFLPWPDLRYIPDFVALVLVFWCVHQPRLIGLGVGGGLALFVALAGRFSGHAGPFLHGALHGVRDSAADQLDGPDGVVVDAPFAGTDVILREIFELATRASECGVAADAGDHVALVLQQPLGDRPAVVARADEIVLAHLDVVEEGLTEG